MDHKGQACCAGSVEGTSSAFTLYERALLIALIIAGLLLRWLELDTRPFHHDESLHGMYGRYFYDWPDQQFYKYQPMLHGPLMYNILRLVYSTVGYTDWGARSLMAFVGSFLLLGPWIFRRYLSNFAVIGLTAAVALSPTLAYWARFLREDTLILFCMLLSVYGATLATSKARAFWVLLGITLQFCIKENSYVTLALLLGYLVFEFTFNYLIVKEKISLAGNIWRNIKSHKLMFLLALAFSTFVYCWVYSAGFRYAQGILDGLYRESIIYWAHHHNIERISGPFLFHFYMLSWYELPFVLAFFLHLYLFYKRAIQPIRTLGLATLGLAFVVALLNSSSSLEELNQIAIWKFFKLKGALDIFGLFILLIHPVLLACQHLLRRERVLAFWGYYFSATFFTYSYLGEKVPWLSVYAFTGGLIYLALFFDSYFKQYPLTNWRQTDWGLTLRNIGVAMVVLGCLFMYQDGIKDNGGWLVIGLALLGIGFIFGKAALLGSYNLPVLLLIIFCVYSLRASLITNFVRAGEASEYISQVHTTREIHALAHQLRKENQTQIRGFKPLIYVNGEAVWPMTWYLRDIPEYRFSAPPHERPNFGYIFQDFADTPKEVPMGFKVVKLNLRGWWVPDFNQITLRKFLQYSLNHTPWSPTGYSYVHLLVNTNR